jgi:hypothetical protein
MHKESADHKAELTATLKSALDLQRMQIQLQADAQARDREFQRTLLLEKLKARRQERALAAAMLVGPVCQQRLWCALISTVMDFRLPHKVLQLIPL